MNFIENLSEDEWEDCSPVKTLSECGFESSNDSTPSTTPAKQTTVSTKVQSSNYDVEIQLESPVPASVSVEKEFSTMSASSMNDNYGFPPAKRRCIEHRDYSTESSIHFPSLNELSYESCGTLRRNPRRQTTQHSTTSMSISKRRTKLATNATKTTSKRSYAKSSPTEGTWKSSINSSVALIFRYNILYISASRKFDLRSRPLDSLVKPLARVGMHINPVYISVDMNPLEIILMKRKMSFQAVFVEEAVNKGIKTTTNAYESNVVDGSKLNAMYLGAALRICKMKYFPTMKLVLILKDRGILQDHKTMNAYSGIYDGALDYPMYVDTVSACLSTIDTYIQFGSSFSNDRPFLNTELNSLNSSSVNHEQFKIISSPPNENIDFKTLFRTPKGNTQIDDISIANTLSSNDWSRQTMSMLKCSSYQNTSTITSFANEHSDVTPVFDEVDDWIGTYVPDILDAHDLASIATATCK